MDDRTRDRLSAELAELKTREARARQQLQTHAANIDQVRRERGNPYFYSGRAADDPESEAHFTGWNSHEPAFQLWQQWREIAQQITAIRKQLRMPESSPRS